jgi:thiamine biosynthesis lipoprotein
VPLFAFPFRAMGSPCEIRLHGPSRSAAWAVAGLAIAEVGRLERKYSRYLETSLATRINRSAGDPEGVRVDEETATLLDYAATAFRESGGRFDVTSGVLRRAWNFREGRVPSRAEVEALLPLVGWDRVRWERPRIVLPLPGMELDFGGYVKEYAADRCAALCRERGAAHGLVDLGGDLAVVGPHPDGSPWRIGIRHPREPGAAMATVSLAGGGLASSGDYERCLVVDGRRYAHVLDPRTGWPVSGLAAVSVAAELCLVAGTASTVAMLMGAEQGPAWLDRLGLPNVRMDAQGRIGGSLAPAARVAGAGARPLRPREPAAVRARRRARARRAGSRRPRRRRGP